MQTQRVLLTIVAILFIAMCLACGGAGTSSTSTVGADSLPTVNFDDLIQHGGKFLPGDGQIINRMWHQTPVRTHFAIDFSSTGIAADGGTVEETAKMLVTALKESSADIGYPWVQLGCYVYVDGVYRSTM